MFKFSSKVKYAIIGLYDIIIFGKNKPVSLSVIIKRNKVPKAYMERILAELVKNKVLKSIKGMNGGFIINTKLRNLSLYKIYQIFNSNGSNDFKNIKNEKIISLINNINNTIDSNLISELKSIDLII